MKVIVAGASQLGESVLQFFHENNEVILIDQKISALEKMEKKYDIQPILGNCCDPDILHRTLSVKNCVFIAATNQDTVNMVSCQMAKNIFHVSVTAARLCHEVYFHEKWISLVQKFQGIDIVLSPEQDSVASILSSFHAQYAFDTAFFVDKKIQLVGIQIDRQSDLYKKTIHHVRKKITCVFICICIVRNHQTFIPDDDDTLMEQDALYFMALSRDVGYILDSLGYPQTSWNRLVLMGASAVGRYLLEHITQDSQKEIVVIEEDETILKHALTPRTLFIHGSYLNTELLLESGIEKATYAIAVTPNDSTNILAALMAHSYGVKHSIALIQNSGSLTSLFTLGIEKMVYPSQRVVSNLLKNMAKNVIDVYPLEGEQSGLVVQVYVDAESDIMPLLTSRKNDGFRFLVGMRENQFFFEPFVVSPQDILILHILPAGYPAFQKFFSINL